MHIDKLERTATQVADNSIWLMDPGHNAERGEMRLTLSRKDGDIRAADALGLGDKSAAVACVPAGSRSDRPDTTHMQDIAQSAEPPERVESRLDGVSGQQTGRLHLPAEPGKHFFIKDRRRGAGQPLINDKTDRVRTDIDNGDRRTIIEPALRRCDDLGRTLTPLR